MERVLPKGWVEATIPELVSSEGIFVDGDWVESKDQDESGDVRLIQLADVGVGNFRDRSARFLTSQKAKELGCTYLNEGDILVARMPDPLGRACIFPLQGKNVTVVDVAIIRTGGVGADSKWLMHMINSPEIQKQIFELASGSTRLRISRSNLAKVPFPLPPLPEQKRIVAKLDAAFKHLDTIKAKLERIPELLKSFRQTVLTQAVTGKLTEDWRKEKSIDSETRLPKNWALASMEDLLKSMKNDLRTGPFGSALKKSDHQHTGVPVWGIETIGDHGEFTNRNKIFVSSEKAKELKSFEVKGGDLIISRSGTVGEICILPDNAPYGLISTNLMKIVLNKAVIVPKYFCWLFSGSQILNEKLNELCKGSTRLFLTQAILKNLDYTLPPLEEQHEIVRRVEALFAQAASLEAGYRSLKEKIDALPQAILAKAFRGELVEQDEADEPASVLLERIKKEKSQMTISKSQTANNKSQKPKAAKLYGANEALSVAAE